MLKRTSIFQAKLNERNLHQHEIVVNLIEKENIKTK